MDAAFSTTSEARFPSFERRLGDLGIGLKKVCLDTVQINLGRLCNQTCLHCHMEAGPGRKEVMTRETALSAVDFVKASGAGTVDLTGGAPEMNPSFRWLTDRLARLGKQVSVRSNLTVLLTRELQDVPEFLAKRGVTIFASMPCYTEENVDVQRGSGVYRESIGALRRLNELGYGREGTGLALHLVYNPGGAFLPGDQGALEMDYRRELASRFGLAFNSLITITNQPIGRFASCLNRSAEMGSYAALLAGSFNAANLPLLMCLRQVCISWDGLLYDCDFNQCLGLPPAEAPHLYRIGKIAPKELAARLVERAVKIGNHCYACTAGSGSSCGGALR